MTDRVKVKENNAVVDATRKKIEEPPESEKPVLILDYRESSSQTESVLDKFMAQQKGPLVEIVDRPSSAAMRAKDEEAATDEELASEKSTTLVDASSLETSDIPDSHGDSDGGEEDAAGSEEEHNEKSHVKVSHFIAPEMLESSPGYLRRQKKRGEAMPEVQAPETERTGADKESEAAKGAPVLAEPDSGESEETSPAGERTPETPLRKKARTRTRKRAKKAGSRPETLLETQSSESPKTLPQSATAETVYKEDGALDVAATLRGYTRTVHSSELAARHKQVQVMGVSKVKTLIQDAVNESVKKLELDWEENEKKRLLDEAEENFNERLKSFQAEKAGIEEHSKLLETQLSRAENLLAEERQKVISAEQFTVSDAGILELEKRLSRLLDRAVVKGGVRKEIEDEMRVVMSNLLDDEREKIRNKAQDAQSEVIALLERKIGRLSSSLEDTQQERDSAQRRAHALEMAGGVAFKNVYTSGLADDDEKDKKLNLLKEIVAGNREVRKFMGEEIPKADSKTETSNSDESSESKKEEREEAIQESG